jgi:hypothetical protein
MAVHGKWSCEKNVRSAAPQQLTEALQIYV